MKLALLSLSLVLATPALFADYSMQTSTDSYGLTLVNSIFSNKGVIELEGVAQKPNPYIFFCAGPKETIRVEGKDRDEAFSKFLETYSSCFSRNPEGKVQVTAPNGVIYKEQNVVSCGCSAKQIDDYFLQHACADSDRFITPNPIGEKCQVWKLEQK